MGSTKEVDCHKSAHKDRFAHEARNNATGSSQEKRNDPRKVKGTKRKRERSKYHFEVETGESASAADV